MDLWNHLQNTPELGTFLTTTLPFALFGVGILAMFTIGFVNPGAGFALMIVLWIAALVVAATTGYTDATRQLEHTQDGVETYVAAQTDLTPLDPVSVRGRTATLVASDDDGALYDVQISWLALDTADASGNLPDGVDPIEMVVNKRGGNDTTPDADPSPESSGKATTSPEPATS